MNCSSRVTTKTLLRFLSSNRTPQRVIERRRHCWLMTDRKVEPAEFFEVTDTRFVKNIVMPEEICLAHVALSETVKDRIRNALRPVADGVDDRLTLSRKLVSVRSVLEGELATRGDDAAVRRNLERLGHRRIQLRRLRL